MAYSGTTGLRDSGCVKVGNVNSLLSLNLAGRRNFHLTMMWPESVEVVRLHTNQRVNKIQIFFSIGAHFPLRETRGSKLLAHLWGLSTRFRFDK